jgi:hypothetical protein
MKLISLTAIFLAAAPLWAGVRIKAEMTDLKTNKTTQQEMLLDNDRLRVNINNGEGNSSSVLFLTDGGRERMVMLDPARNEYREMDRQSMEQVSQQLQGVMSQLQSQLQNLPPEQRARVEQMMKGRAGPASQAGAAPARTTYAAKGSSTVNGFACTNYEGTRGSEKVADVCAAKPAHVRFNPADFQVFEKMKEFAGSFASGLANAPLANNRFADLMQAGYEGFPIQQTSYSGGQATTKMEVKSIERAGLSDADFSLGSAKKVDLMPGRR